MGSGRRCKRDFSKLNSMRKRSAYCGSCAIYKAGKVSAIRFGFLDSSPLAIENFLHLPPFSSEPLLTLTCPSDPPKSQHLKTLYQKWSVYAECPPAPLKSRFAAPMRRPPAGPEDARMKPHRSARKRKSRSQ